MNRIALRDAPPVTRSPDADSEHVEQRHWPSGVTCTAIFGLLLGYFLGAYFKTPGGTNISRPAMLSCYVTARSPSGNKGGRLQGVDRRRRARTLTLSRDDKFARINFPRLFRISYARHRPAAFPLKKKTDCPNIFIASKRDVQSKQSSILPRVNRRKGMVRIKDDLQNNLRLFDELCQTPCIFTFKANAQTQSNSIQVEDTQSSTAGLVRSFLFFS
ncbi:hypothetical protein CAJAP_00318 [Camponotus japonicus]